MRKIALFSCIALVAGCSLLNKKAPDADAAAEAGPVADQPAAVVDAAPAAAPVVAKNSADIARFPAAETAVADDDQKIAAATPAMTGPKSGNVVATLKVGSDVTKIAEYHNAILATFADPKDGATTLMGWIGKEAFVATAVVHKDGGVTDAAVDAAPAAHDAGPMTCAAGTVAVILSKDPVCRKKCTKDADCKGGAAGACANAQTATKSVAKVCVADQ